MGLEATYHVPQMRSGFAVSDLGNGSFEGEMAVLNIPVYNQNSGGVFQDEYEPLFVSWQRQNNGGAGSEIHHRWMSEPIIRAFGPDISPAVAFAVGVTYYLPLFGNRPSLHNIRGIAAAGLVPQLRHSFYATKTGVGTIYIGLEPRQISITDVAESGFAGIAPIRMSISTGTYNEKLARYTDMFSPSFAPTEDHMVIVPYVECVGAGSNVQVFDHEMSIRLAGPLVITP